MTEVFLTHTEVFPCFFLSCKATARVKLTKTGHGPNSSTLVCICVVRLFVLFYVLFVCKCVLPPGDNPNAVNKYINIISKRASVPNQNHGINTHRRMEMQLHTFLPSTANSSRFHSLPPKKPQGSNEWGRSCRRFLTASQFTTQIPRLPRAQLNHSTD